MQANAHPIFFIWESDIQSVIENNLHEINKERIFKRLLIQLTKFTVGKLLDREGGKDTGQLTLPNDNEVAIKINSIRNDPTAEEPYTEIEAQPNLQPLNQNELDFFETQLKTDPSIQNALNDLVSHDVSTTTLMSKDIVQQLEQEAMSDGSRNIIFNAFFINKLRKILTQIIERFIKKRDHGVYTTVIEEILRELYVDRVGEFVWSTIKKETVDIFEGVNKGGTAFLGVLSSLLTSGQQPEVTLIGHSAGAVFICNLLKEFQKQQASSDPSSLQNFKFKNVLFLAPACDFEIFNDVLTNCLNTFENFRMFTMNDALEGKDAIVPGIYTKSLLYFISGMLEKDTNNPNKSAYDHPIMGMERYYTNTNTYTETAVNNVRNYILNTPNHVVWSISNLGAGLSTASVSHGGFAEERETLASIQQIISKE